MAVISLKAAKLDRIAARINAAHANAEAASATVVQCAVEAGQLLLEVKETMAHGAFGTQIREIQASRSRWPDIADQGLFPDCTNCEL